MNSKELCILFFSYWSRENVVNTVMRRLCVNLNCVKLFYSVLSGWLGLAKEMPLCRFCYRNRWKHTGHLCQGRRESVREWNKGYLISTLCMCFEKKHTQPLYPLFPFYLSSASLSTAERYASWEFELVPGSVHGHRYIRHCYRALHQRQPGRPAQQWGNEAWLDVQILSAPRPD